MSLDASMIKGIAVAVFVGNMMTIAVIKGYQRMKAEGDGFNWTTAGLFCGPLLFTAVTVWLAR